MIILDVPNQFQPEYSERYPPYSNGKNMEETLYEYFVKNKDEINTTLIYIPVFWTSYYLRSNYQGTSYNPNMELLYNWLDTIDKTNKYFTIVQYDSGIHIRKNFSLDITVFCGGGGGLVVNNPDIINEAIFHGMRREFFVGKKGDYDIPLICQPEFPRYGDIKKDIFCSFIGRFDTHPCRMKILEVLRNDNKYHFYPSTSIDEYKLIVNRSVFTLAPRGYGYTSFRMYEAIMANSIPVYIWENENLLPFQDKVNWNDFAIVIHSSDIEKLPQLLENVDIEKMRSELEKVKHMFTFDYTYEYIVEKISEK